MLITMQEISELTSREPSIGKEAFLLAKYLRSERDNWIPRIPRTPNAELQLVGNEFGRDRRACYGIAVMEK